MADLTRFRIWLCAVASAALLAATAVIASPAGALDNGPQGSTGEGQSVDLQTAPEMTGAPRPANLAINRPTMPLANYLAAKYAAAARAPGKGKPGPAAPRSATDLSLVGQAPTVNQTQSCCFPPDGDIATSASWMVQTVNNQIAVFNWNTNASALKSFATFFGDSTNFLFDPRVLYDPYFDRFIIVADGCINCANTTTNVSQFDVAVSQTGDPTGKWYIYKFGVVTNKGDFADFPQMGMDLNSLIFTYNDFLGNGGFDSRVFSLNKALMYSGRGTAFSAFGGGTCTIAPPLVLDNNGVDYIMQFCPNATSVSIGSLTATGLTTAAVHMVDNTVDVDFSGVPPNAVQPGVDYPLETGDNRFENRSLQVGSRIINTATISAGSTFPIPAYYNFNIGVSPHTFVSDGDFFASGTSFDWRPSIVANTVAAPSGTPLGEVFVTWMSTDVTTNVQLRAGGWIGDSGFTTGVPVFTSSIPLTGQTDASGRHRTGDYSYITTYPAAAFGCQTGEIGILEGETSGPAAGTWGTHVGVVKHC
jgi:hypothetical protein